MKIIKTTHKLILMGLFLVFILGFTIEQQMSQEKELILGTWFSVDNSDSKWIFTSDGILKRYYNDKIHKAYTYSITQEKSLNGLFNINYLRLVDIKNSKNVFEYEINTIGEHNLVLEYLKGSRSDLIYFKKQ